ncbi:MAG: vWA domain-containing protein [Planctomycetota bacterium]
MQPPSTTFQNSWKSLLTGGAGSVVLHAAAFLLIGLSLRGCQSLGQGVPGGEPFREVGLVVVDGVQGGAAATGSVAGIGDHAQTLEAPRNPSEMESDVRSELTESGRVADRVPSEAPDIESLLSRTEANTTSDGDSSSDLPLLIGSGQPRGGAMSGKSGGGGSPVQPLETGGAAKVGGVGGEGNTSFMNITGVGQTFVYVIDISASMDEKRLKLAQSQLKASLRLLQPGQKFAIILYNEMTQRLKPGRRPPADLYPASDLNIRLFEAAIDRIHSSLGTDHKPALMEALNLKPDVVYFLTDGADELSPAALREISGAAGKTTIHVIQFGDGTLTTRETSWLEKLARQTSGEFRLFNVDAN